MITDPYRIAADAYCPACGVKGRMVAEDEDRGDDGNEWTVESRTCVDCGHCHDEPTHAMDFHIKAMRVQFGRLIEGRPYEPPPPPEPAKRSPTMEAMDQMLREHYGPDAIEQSAAKWNALGSGPGYEGIIKVTGTICHTFAPGPYAPFRVIANHPGYQGTFIIPPDDEDGE